MLFRSFTLVSTIALAALGGCVLEAKVGSKSDESNGTGASSGSGGSSATGGTTATGGTSASGGTTATGGTAGMGGASSGPETLLTSCRIGNLAQDTDALYFFIADFTECDGSGRIVRWAKTGGNPVTLATVNHSPTKLVVDGADVYWTISTDVTLGVPKGSLSKVPKQGGQKVTLATGDLADLGVFQGYAYFVDVGPYPPTYPVDPPNQGTVQKVPTSGGTPVVIAKDITEAAWLSVDASGVYFSGAPPETPTWANGNPIFKGVEAGVWRVGTSGGTPELLAVDMTSLNLVMQIEVDANKVYFSRASAPGLFASPKSLVQPPIPDMPTAFGTKYPWRFALDGDRVYLSVFDLNKGTEMLWRQNKDGSQPTMLAPYLGGQIRTLAVDSTHVYWAVRDEAKSPSLATLYRVAK